MPTKPWHDTPFYFDYLSDQIFHVTSEDGYRGIVADQKIRANRGERPFTFAQSSTSFARHMGYVALFDFLHCSSEKIIGIKHIWSPVIARHDPAMVLIFNHENLGETLVTSANAAVDFSDAQVMKSNYHVPRVEAWYPEAIPFALCSSVLRIDWRTKGVSRVQ